MIWAEILFVSIPSISLLTSLLKAMFVGELGILGGKYLAN
jgi:hypothetical protein